MTSPNEPDTRDEPNQEVAEHRGFDHVGVLLAHMRLEWLLQHFQSRLVRAVYVCINGFITIGLLAFLVLLTGSPFVFPSLGPTAYLFFFSPMAEASSPRKYHSRARDRPHLWLCCLCAHRSLKPAFRRASRCSCCEGLGRCTLTLGYRCAHGSVPGKHPPAGATTLIVSLGIISQPKELVIIEVAVILLTAQAFAINRLAGIPYPLWRNHAPSREGDGAMGNFDNQHPWELCTTLTVGAWGYQPKVKIKTRDDVIRLLVGAVGRDGNLICRDSGIKIGTETFGDISKILFERCRIVSGGRGPTITHRQPGNIEDVEFREIDFLAQHHAARWWGWGEAASVTVWPRTLNSKTGSLSNIRFKNVRGVAENSFRIDAHPEMPIKNVLLEDCSVEIDRWTQYPGGMFDNRPPVQTIPCMSPMDWRSTILRRFSCGTLKARCYETVALDGDFTTATRSVTRLKRNM